MKRLLIICLTAVICSAMLSYAIVWPKTQELPKTVENVSTEEKLKYGTIDSMGVVNDRLILLDKENGDLYSVYASGAGNFKIFRTKITKLS